MQIPAAIHLAIIQPAGYVHSLGFLDQARYFRHMFRRLGAQVTMTKNRLREDALNFVFGAHLGFPADWQQRHACVFVNLEQLGEGGAAVSADYLALLRGSAVADYDLANVPVYAQDAADVPIVSFGYGAYLDQPALPLEQRPIDLLFFGSVNQRRREFIARVEAAGFNVSAFDSPLYGPERDNFIRSAKAVLNCHFYETNRFEQARAFHCLSMGTPVISECTPTTAPSPAFVDSVLWLPERVEEWFGLHFGKPLFYEEARKRLAAFRVPDADHDPLAQYVELLEFATGFRQGFAQVRAPGAWRPRAMHLGAGAQYKPTWLNVDTRPGTEPDLVLDLSAPLTLPCDLPTRTGGSVRLEPGTLELVLARDALERAADLPAAMGNLLVLLKTGGSCAVDLPLANAPDAARRRTLDAHSWADYTDDFWRAGWFEQRFEMAQPQWLDDACQPVARERATTLRIVLRKRATTPRERTLARTMRIDFGGFDDDIAGADAAVVGSAAERAPRRPQTPFHAPAPAKTTDGSVAAAGANPAGLPASLLALLLDG